MGEIGLLRWYWQRDSLLLHVVSQNMSAVRIRGLSERVLALSLWSKLAAALTREDSFKKADSPSPLPTAYLPSWNPADHEWRGFGHLQPHRTARHVVS